MPILGQISTPRDLAELNLSELNTLCAEIRQVIIETVAKNGGHLSSNLGVVELTVALHVAFSSPEDKIVWDVGHQCYAHKLLTGRRSVFHTLRQADGVAGFPRREESAHDAFDTGHASTAISAALGLLSGEILKGGSALAIAVVGDGALTGGLAYEALSNAGQLELPLIIILNDNKMSIDENVGGLSEHLSRLSMKGRYQRFRRNFDSLVRKIPFAGESLYRLVNRLKRAVKAVVYHENFFVDLGFEYVGPVDGHDLRQLIPIFRDVRRLRRPVVVHVVSKKGRGYKPAEEEPGVFHSVPPFSVEEGKLPAAGESWTRAFGTALLEAARACGDVVAITAAMEKGTGISRFKSEFPHRFYDVGIAEAHAVTFAAALALRGLRPVAAIYSTFIQRAVDSIIHDTAISGSPVVFAIDRAGFVSGDGETHQGLFDISIIRMIPNMTLLAPATGAELKLMLNWALSEDLPCAIRYPKAALPQETPEFSAPVERGRGVLVRCAEGRAASCVLFTGSLCEEARGAVRLLAARGVFTDLYNLRFIKPIDEDYIAGLLSGYALAVIAEEGVLAGGVGEYIGALAARRGIATEIVTIGAQDRFYPQASRQELLNSAGLDARGIAAALQAALTAPSLRRQ
ncbi:MAG: 1-deoxy-D-xylulose-5-phosphate synthase [Spirochaetaceae bacterium]|jgi:1-deoxy-D-xylulose-5-phosphate synthase|nr:1-deoxy-D-xylulose-5-phosphate synthase [Spirochaetaceae bacterium]